MVLVPLLILPVATILTQLLVKPLKIAMSKKMMAGTIMVLETRAPELGS